MSESTKKLADVIAMVQKDGAAKARLLKNPTSYMEKALDVKLPAGQAIKVAQDTAFLLHVVLPIPSGGEKHSNVMLNMTGALLSATNTSASCFPMPAASAARRSVYSKGPFTPLPNVRLPTATCSCSTRTGSTICVS